MNLKRMVLMGPPGAGKGTQAARVSVWTRRARTPGLPYPKDDRFTIVVWDRVPDQRTLLDSDACVTGEVTSYKGLPQIESDSLDAVAVTSALGAGVYESMNAPPPSGPEQQPLVDSFGEPSGGPIGTDGAPRCGELDYPQLPYPARPLSVLTGQTFSRYARVIQDALNYLGYGCLAEDGKFGSRTRQAVRLFQSGNHLEVDGVVGE